MKYAFPFCGALVLAATLSSSSAFAADEANFCTVTTTTAGPQLALVGTAQLTATALRLLNNNVNTAGAAWLSSSSIALDTNTSFHTHFRFNLTAGGEGFTFALQTTGTTALGGTSGSLGYGGIAASSLAVEFDISDSGATDPDANHVALRVNGGDHVAGAPVATNAVLGLTLTGANRDAWIDYDGPTNHVLVYVDASSTKPSTPVIDYQNAAIDLAAGTAYVGFTAASSGPNRNVEDILYWSFTSGATLHDCVTCSSGTGSAPCGNPFPVCNTTLLQCDRCSSDFGGGSLACPSAGSPACQPAGASKGSCSQCSATVQNLCAAAGPTPACDTASGTCSTCTGDNGATTARPCSTSAAPACQAGGATCTQCSPTNTARCANPSPACGPSNACTACNGDQGSSATAPCPTTTAPACQTNGTCGACNAGRFDQCTGTNGACNTTTGACVPCGGDFGSGSPSACNTAAQRACQPNGSCTQCTTANLGNCSGATPTCDTAGTCAACTGDFGGTANRPCISASEPACEPNGSCGVCSATFTGLCTGTTPTCDVTGPSPVCAACTGDNGDATASRPCTTTANPYCVAGGANGGSCGKCTSSSECVGHPLGSVCNTVTGSCGTSCTSDAACTGAQWCANGVCTAKTPNGQPVPPTAGACSSSVGVRVCLSGVCDASDNVCGKANGSVCTNTGDAGADAAPTAPGVECRSGICADDGRCGKPNGQSCLTSADCRSTNCEGNVCVQCTTDAQCGAVDSGSYCNTTTHACVAGCRPDGSRTCAAGATCVAATGNTGTCASPADAGPDASPVVDASVFDATTGDDASTLPPPAGDAAVDASGADLGGEGCGCVVPGVETRSAGWLTMIGALAATAAVGARRRRRSRPGGR